ncbi:MAG: hypothetical protein WA005_12150 [Candidatus Binataceae bacterium]
MAFKGDEQHPFLGYEMSQGRDYSEATAARIDQEVLQLIEEAHEEVRRRLTDNREKLDRLVEALLREETVAAEQLNRILGPRPQLMPGQDGRPNRLPGRNDACHANRGSNVHQYANGY